MEDIRSVKLHKKHINLYKVLVPVQTIAMTILLENMLYSKQIVSLGSNGIRLVYYTLIIVINILVMSKMIDNSQVAEKEKLLKCINYLMKSHGENDALKKVCDEIKASKQENEQILNLLLNEGHLCVFIWKPEGEILEFNEEFKNKFHVDEDFVGRNWVSYYAGHKEQEKVQAILEGINKNGICKNAEVNSMTWAGDSIHMLWTSTKYNHIKTNEELVISFGLDISKERLKDKKIYESITVDRISGLKNKNMFLMDVISDYEAHRNLTVIQLSIHNFRRLNDIHGYNYGDVLISQVGSQLKEIENISAYKLQSDSFAFYFVGDHKLDIDHKLAYINHKLNMINELDGLSFKPVFRFAIIRTQTEIINEDNILAKLAVTMDKAKEKNALVVYYDQAFLNDLIYYDQLENAVSDALENEDFTLNFQPIYTLKMGELRGWEVLLRWYDNILGETNIFKVIEYAEKSGQILKIDMYVFKKVVEEFSETSIDISSQTISINVSAFSFFSENFYTFVCEILSQYEINFTIEFELTEHSIIQDVELASYKIKQFKRLGIKFALDDFGTKYSSLNYLRKLEFDVVKIDKIYIDKINYTYSDATIVKNLINLCHELNIETLCEGVETIEQADLLKMFKAVYVQGYYFKKPMDLMSLERLLQKE